MARQMVAYDSMHSCPNSRQKGLRSGIQVGDSLSRFPVRDHALRSWDAWPSRSDARSPVVAPTCCAGAEAA
jgi:hypothetical protein